MLEDEVKRRQLIDATLLQNKKISAVTRVGPGVLIFTEDDMWILLMSQPVVEGFHDPGVITASLNLPPLELLVKYGMIERGQMQRILADRKAQARRTLTAQQIEERRERLLRYRELYEEFAGADPDSL